MTGTPVLNKSILKSAQPTVLNVIYLRPRPQTDLTGDCGVLKFFRLNVDGKHLMRFQSEIPVFKFLRRNVARA